MQINEVLQVVEDEFKLVNQLIYQQLESRVPLVEKVAEYIISSGGKRMRPLLVLLTAKAFDECNERAAMLAATIEFIHTATLLHDDVVDVSDLRRGRATANAKFGNAPSVLVGDFLYSRSFEMLVTLGNLPVMQTLSSATSTVAEGEVLQLTNVKNPDTTEAQYMEVIKGKTAMLFEASTHGAAQLINRTPEQCEALRVYGQELGLAFQLIDDVLDYEGNTAEMGKNVGDDLAEGKPTLPLIHAMAHGDDSQRTLIRKIIRQAGANDLEERLSEVLNIVHQLGSIEYTRAKANECAQRAIEQLAILPESAAKQALIALANISVQRHV